MGVPLAVPLASLVFSVADDDSAARLSREVDRVLEEHAPGFTELVVAKSMHRASDWKPGMPHTGAVNGGRSQLYQQLIFRPAPGLGRAETPIEQLYLGSADATPGGGVHGVCGRNAALASDGCARLAAVPAEPGRPSTGNPLRPGIEPHHVAPAILRCFRIPGASLKPPD